MDAATIKSFFETRFGAPPALVVRAPGRINLLGEHVDYNGGLVLPAAIDKAIWLAASPRRDARLAFFAADLGEFFEAEKGETHFQTEKSWANYLLGVIDEARRDGHRIGGFDLAFGGDVPLGAGLSSSAALESGAGLVLNALFGLGLEKMDIVRLAQRGENEFVGMKCGVMDMFASVMGRAGCVVRLDCRSLDFAFLPFENPDFSLVLLDSGVKHSLVDSEYNARRAECERGAELLKKHDPSIESLRDVAPAFLKKHEKKLPATVARRCRFVVEEIERVESACAALAVGDLETVGALMFEGHAGLRDLYEVCVAETDFLVEKAQNLGAIGARQMGGGFGGCTINLLQTKAIEPFLAEISAAYQAAFGLDLRAYPVRLTDGVGQV